MAYIDKRDNRLVTESPEGSRIVNEIVQSNAFPGPTDYQSVIEYLMNEANKRGFSEEVPMQAGYSDESGTYDESGQLIDYLNKARYEGRTQEDWRNISEPSGMAHDAIDSEIMKDTVKNNPSLMKFLLQKYLFSQ